MSELKPSIGLYPTTSLVVGSMIGSGIFISTAGMARSSTSANTLIWVWIVGGLLTLFGALAQCELCGTYPKTGGLYVYLREAFGEKTAFFYGWANFMIAGSGAIAAISFIFGTYLNEFFPLWQAPKALSESAWTIPYLGKLFPFANLGEKIVASSIVIFLTWLNTRGVRLGALLQSVSTTAKVLALFTIISFGLFFSNSHPAAVAPITPPLHFWQSLGLFMMMLNGAFWSYDGWGNVAYVAGEVKRPERTIPLASIIGTFLVIGVYILVNLAYLHVFSIEELGKVEGDRVASALMNQVAGIRGAQFVALAILLSTFDTTNSSTLSNARVYFAMAKEGLFAKSAGEVHPKYGTPAVSLWYQCGWTLVLIFTGSFELITSTYVWVNWLFYLLMALAVFVFRRRKLPRTFTAWGYPYLPALFIIFTLFYLGMTLIEDIRAYQAGEAPIIKSVVGILLVLAGTPFYLLLIRKRGIGASLS